MQQIHVVETAGSVNSNLALGRRGCSYLSSGYYWRTIKNSVMGQYRIIIQKHDSSVTATSKYHFKYLVQISIDNDIAFVILKQFLVKFKTQRLNSNACGPSVSPIEF
jgi:hypothetical protein